MIIAAWIIFALACLGLLSVFLTKAAAVAKLGDRSRIMPPAAGEGFLAYLRHKAVRLLSRLWHHILEAKDLRPTAPAKPAAANRLGRVRQVFKIRIKHSESEPDWMPEVADSVETRSEEPKQTPEQIFLAAIKKNPNDRSAYEGLGQLYLQERNYQEAIETFRFLSRLDPKRDTYWSNLGLSLYSVGEHLQAIAAYEKALTINKKVPARWINLSLCFEALDEHGKAIKTILAALQLDRKNVNYLTMLADIYIKVDNKVRAEEVLEEILTVDPTSRTAREKLMKVKI
ncbi:MAG: tetratricopeptide repeat protein [Candidatus Saccharibacteria bacterium]